MDTYFASKPRTPKLIDLMKEREIDDSSCRKLVTKRNVTEDLICRLGLEKELTGHQGCVNCLQWNDTGEILASASDDLHIILWNPFSYKRLCSFHSGHVGNIFSVKFMPKSNSEIVISGAADAMVKVFNLSFSGVLYTCTCHMGRVKRLATAANVPHLFWSAGEGGLVLQHDLRTPHNCGVNRKTVLVNLVDCMGRTAEAKCMAINPMRPELVAVGANDPYIRMYDRRMIKLDQVPVETFAPGEIENDPANPRSSAKKYTDDRVPSDCVQYFIAGHLRSDHREEETVRRCAATYVTFSSDGNELLVNMGAEQIYLFDITRARHNRLFDSPSVRVNAMFPDENDEEQSQKLLSSTYGTDLEDDKDYSSMNEKVLPDHVQELKLEANNKFTLNEYVAAINLYNKALGFCPMASVLYGNRAAALMMRKWDGDIYAALRDCQTTLLLDPEHVKAHFRLARCLYELNRPFEAYRVIVDFEKKFPQYARNAARIALLKDISEAIVSNASELSECSRQTLSSSEQTSRRQTIDYKLRYCGHCNTTTDIKEANFFGSDGQYIIAGSDDGNIFIWDRYTTNIIRILGGDSKIVNCLQPHPSSCFLATSGIDPIIRLWSPLPEKEDKPNERAVENADDVAQKNQVRMHSDPFTLMMMDMTDNLADNFRLTHEDTEAEDRNNSVVLHQACRPS